MSGVSTGTGKGTERGLPPLEFALRFEIRGAALYLRLASQTENPLARDLFYSLAAEEIEHARRVDQIYAAVKRDSGRDAGRERRLPPVETKMRDLFRRSDAEALRRGDGNAKAYEIARRMERRGYRVYRSFLESAGSTVEREFFRRLLAEEESHFEALDNVYTYLTDAADWLQNDESRVWNWMNFG